MNSREILHRVGEDQAAGLAQEGGWERFDVGDGLVRSSAAFTVPFLRRPKSSCAGNAAATATMTGTLQLLGQPWPARRARTSSVVRGSHQRDAMAGSRAILF
jgi:hypothetical protein